MNKSEVRLCNWCHGDPALEDNVLCYACYDLIYVSWNEDSRTQQEREEEDDKCSGNE